MLSMGRARNAVCSLGVLGVLGVLGAMGALGALLALASCTKPAPARHAAARWVAAHALPRFDPDDAPDALRWALERHLSRGLVERDSLYRVRYALAESIACSTDSLTWRFRLRAGIRFTDGTPVTSEHLREALVGGLAREDQSTRAWLLVAVRGVSKVRAGRALPALGIETPDPRTLVLRLERPDRRLLEKLAVPGVSTPWKRRHGSWRDAVGVGPYRVLDCDGSHALTLVATAPVGDVSATVDTLRVRFAQGAVRVRSILRAGVADALWPLPPGLLDQPLPRGWELIRKPALPARRLLLVLRADVPPLTRPAARRSLAGAINREELLAALGRSGEPLRRWIPGARTDYDWPRLETTAERLARHAAAEAIAARRDGRPESFHVVLAYDADMSGAEVARSLQGQWARAGHYAELRPLRGEAVLAEALGASAAQVQLVESQALLEGGEAELAQLVMPLRGPAVGSFRTGWRTRDLDRWVAVSEPAPGFEPDGVQALLAADRIVLPVAQLPWLVAVRTGGPAVVVRPGHGPDWTAVNSAGGDPRRR